MHLSELRLRDFRAFEDASVEFPPMGVVLVVGANNSGKTSLLSAFDLVAKTRGISSATRIGAVKPIVEATFEVTDEERMRLVGTNPQAGRWLATNAFRQFRVSFTQVDESSLVESIELRDAGGVFHLVADNQPVAEAPPGNRVARAVDTSSLLNEGPEGRAFEISPVQLSQGGIGDYIPWQVGELAWYSNLLSAWRAGVYHFDALRQGTGRSTASRGVVSLSPTGIDLPEALLHLKSNDDPAWERIVEVMKDIVPDVGTLASPVVGDQVSVAFHNPFLGVKHNVKDLGTGVEQLLMTVYVGVRQPAGSVVIVEEPETNLHPAAQRALLRYIRDWSEDKLFILGTHSTVFLDETLGQNRVVLVERQRGIATGREASADLQDVLLSLGVRLSDVLSAERVLLVEGDSDAEILRGWFPSLSIATGTAIAGMGGGDRAWDIEIYANISNAADRLGRTVLMIRDRDELSSESVGRLEERGLIHVLERRELENYLLDIGAIRTVLDRQAAANPESRRAASEESVIEELLRATAEGLHDTVILKRVVARIRNVRLISRADVADLIQRGPTLENLLDVVGARVRTHEELTAKIRGFWREETEALDGIWNARWRELAPGAELLAAVWKEHGGAFEKGRDGVMIAREMMSPPIELAAIVAHLEESTTV
jgi:energy-coupling factor transporter ATP-binding protein EcfA2